MLKGVQAERGDGRGVGMAEDAEHAALFAEAVAVEVEDADSGSSIWSVTETAACGRSINPACPAHARRRGLDR